MITRGTPMTQETPKWINTADTSGQLSDFNAVYMQLEISWCRHRISQVEPFRPGFPNRTRFKQAGFMASSYRNQTYNQLEHISRSWTNHHHIFANWFTQVLRNFPPRQPEELFPVVIFRGWLEAIVEGVHANVLAATWPGTKNTKKVESKTMKKHPWVVFHVHVKQALRNYKQNWLVVWTPLKNMSSSIGMMKFPILIGK